MPEYHPAAVTELELARGVYIFREIGGKKERRGREKGFIFLSLILTTGSLAVDEG